MLWRQIDKYVYKIAGALCILSTGLAIILMLLEVLTRFILGISAPWTGELVRAMYIYIVFFGLILVEREGSQIRTTLLIEKFPPRAHRIWETIVAVLSVLFNICLFIGCFYAIPSTLTFLGSVPGVSEKIFYYPIIVSVPFAVMYQLRHLVLLYSPSSERMGEEENKK